MSVLTRGGMGLIDWLRRYPVLLLIPVSILIGFMLAVSGSPLIVGALLALVPVVMVEIAFIRNLFLGVAAYLVMEYLQPGFRFPALAVVRPSLLITAALFVAWLLNVMQHRTRMVLNWQVKSYVVFILLAALSSFDAISTGKVLKTLMLMFKTLAIFFIIYSIVNTVPKLRQLIWTYVTLHLILGLMAFALFFTTGQRNMGDLGGSFLGDENDAAMALLIMIPYTYFMFGQTKHKLIRVALIVSITLSSGAVLYSFSRGAFIGYASMMLYVWGNSQKKHLATVVLIIAAVTVMGVMPSTYWERIESTKNYGEEGSAQGRLDAWRGGVEMMLDKPLTGVGLGNFNRTYGTNYNTINTRWTAAHSMYIQFIAELGVPGLIFLALTIFLTFKTFRHIRRACRGRLEPEYVTLNAIARGGECGFAAYLVATVFLNSMNHPHLWHFGAVAGCGILALKDLQRRERRAQDLELVESEEAAAAP